MHFFLILEYNSLIVLQLSFIYIMPYPLNLCIIYLAILMSLVTARAPASGDAKQSIILTILFVIKSLHMKILKNFKNYLFFCYSSKL